MSITLNAVDISVVILYFIVVFFIAYFVTTKEKKSSEDYFLGGRNVGWFVIGASLFASNIGSEHLIGLAGSGAKGGVAVAQFEILAGIILLLLGWVFVPFYLRSGVSTMPEFLEMRYNKTARRYLSVVSILAYVLTKISVTIFAGAVVFESIGVEFWTGAMILVVVTGIYTVFGGLKAVIYNDMMQMFVMLFGSLALTYYAYNSIGSSSELKALVDNSYWTMWKPMTDPDFPWTGIIFGAPILGVWYWCTDQFIVQRVLSAKNITHARRGTIFGGFLKQLPLFIFVLPGILAMALVNKGQMELASPDHALPTLVATVLPTGLRGLVIAGLFAALMSSLSSVFNSCSTLITYDFYKNIKPDSSEKQLIVFGQLSTVVLVIIGLFWIPMMDYIQGTLYNYIQSVQAYISPPIASIFLLGIFIKRLNGKGALASLYTGFALGVGRLILEINKSSLTEGSFLYNYCTINFLHFALFLFIVCSVVLISVSLLTKADNNKDISEITFDWSSKLKFNKDIKIDSLLSISLLIIITLIWIYFS